MLTAAMMDVDASNFNDGTENLLVADSGQSLTFKLISSEKEFFDENSDAGTSFHPEFTHQQFGEQERIYGYENLQVRLYYGSCSLKSYLSITYDSKVEDADEIQSKLEEILPPDHMTSMDDFVSAVEKENEFVIPGELIVQSTINDTRSSNGNNSVIEYQIHKCNFETPGLKQYHARIQTFLMFFIDAASFIDSQDTKWVLYLMHIKCPETGLLKFAGYSTVYDFFAYPNLKRPRISQILLLPPYQGKALGRTLLQSIYDDNYARPEVLEMTVEDASEGFQILRDMIDVMNTKQLIAKMKREREITLAKGGMIDHDKTIDKLPTNFSKSFATLLQSNLKMNKIQSRRVFEILKLAQTDRSDAEAYRDYRLVIKSRIHNLYKEHLDTLATRNEKLLLITGLYKTLEDYYQNIIDRVSAL